MDVVRAPPEIVGRQRQHAEDAADPIVGARRSKERTVAAVVLDHEQPHQEGGRRDGKDQAGPIPHAQRIPQQEPARGEGNHGYAELENTASRAWRAVAAQDPAQCLRLSG